jgi:hypothetical protein
MQGLDAIGNELKIPDIHGGGVTKYPLSGDPVKGTGWIDGTLYPPGDRRMMISSGPFKMESGEAQEIIIAQIAAGGDEDTDRYEAIDLMKSYNQLAEEIYEHTFNFSSSQNVLLSNVNYTELDNEIIFSWYDNDNLDLIERNKFLNFEFQGYNIYQYPDKNFKKSDAVIVKTFDLIDGITIIGANEEFSRPKISGRNSGLKRHSSISKNIFNSDRPLNNGTEYYFGISTYSVNSDHNFYPRVVESEPYKLTVIPQSPKPGNLFEGKYGQEIEVQPSNGQSNIPINIKIVDPTKLIDKSYILIFNINEELPDSSLERIELTLMDNEGNTLYARNTITLKDKLGIAKSIIIDGFEIEPFDIKDYDWNPLVIEDGDQFTFSTPKAVLGDYALAQQQVEKINVFPNPYYGKQENETNQYQKFVTFNHLPPKANIKIFNLGGQLVNTLEKNDQSQFLRWDLTNGKNFWVPSGIYIVYIEMPELNKTKILKLAVIMENIIPDYF